jgi:hypothetical protein
VQLSPYAPAFIPRIPILADATHQQLIDSSLTNQSPNDNRNSHMTAEHNSSTNRSPRAVDNFDVNMTDGSRNTTQTDNRLPVSPPAKDRDKTDITDTSEPTEQELTTQFDNTADYNLRQQFIQSQRGDNGELSQQITPQQRRMKNIKDTKGKRIVKRQAFYKVYFENDNEPHWLPAQELPVQLLLDYNVEKYKKKRNARARQRRAFDY